MHKEQIGMCGGYCGAGDWRGTMPMRGTDGVERAAIPEKFLSPIQAWCDGLSEQRACSGQGRPQSLMRTRVSSPGSPLIQPRRARSEVRSTA